MNKLSRISMLPGSERYVASPFAIPTDHSPAECDRLFAAVLVDDEISEKATLPADINLDFGRNQLASFYGICLQVWRDGVDRPSFCTLVENIYRDRSLSSGDQVRYKHIRAKFKLLRFAYTLFGEDHRYPTRLDLITRLMGTLQDDFKNRRTGAVGRNAILLRLALTRIPFALITREVESLQLTSRERFDSYELREFTKLKLAVSVGGLTGRQFHHVRKIISRQVALFNCLRALQPTERNIAIFRYLSTINGLMGTVHDALVIRRNQDRHAYERVAFPIPLEIDAMLRTFLAHLPC